MNRIISKPLITEKTMQLAQKGIFTFVVAKHASKGQIGAAVSGIYKVDAIGVNTVSMHGKVRKAGRRQVKKSQPDWKKAMIRLKSGQKIEAFQVTPEEPVKK
jgi:large subunit ribosomal protein L23